MKKLLTLTFAMLLAFVLVACGGGTKPESIEIKVSAKSVLVSKSTQLTATVKPAGASQEVIWSSDNNAIATVDESGKVTGVKAGRAVITATSKEDSSVSQKVTITVREGSGDDLDFEGYEIKVAYSPQVEYELDPRLEYSANSAPSADRIYDAQAWDEVCDKYNCTITVAGYPTTEYWERFTYIIDQGKKNVTDFDIYWIPTNYIAQLYTVLMELTDFYTMYGNNTMSQNDQLARTIKQSQLYGWSRSSGNITPDDPILGMNYELLKRIHMEDKEPAKLFMEDKWSLNEFVDWCKEAQDKLNGLSTGEDDKYYVITGRLSSWLRDMSAACGVALADTLDFKIKLLDPTVVEIANKLHELYEYGCVDPADQTDEKVVAWNNQHALLNCASSYWVDYENRWKSDLWGSVEETNYAFVPWPYKNGGTHESLRWSNYTQDCFVMPKAVTEKIKGASEDVTPANIFKIWVECFTRAQEIKEASDEYDKATVNRINAQNKWDTEASVTAWLFIQNRLDTIGIFNAIKELRQGNGVREEWDKAASGYIVGTSEATDYVAAMSELIKDLQNTFISHYN